MLDVADPVNPAIVGSATGVGDFPTSVFVEGGYAYVVASSSKSLTVVNVVDPVMPVALESVIDPIDLDGAALGVFVSGELAYVAASTSDALTVVRVCPDT